jgi:hypothetical protein
MAGGGPPLEHGDEASRSQFGRYVGQGRLEDAGSRKCRATGHRLSRRDEAALDLHLHRAALDPEGPGKQDAVLETKVDAIMGEKVAGRFAAK